jgi:toxin HigB-1
LWHEIKYEYMEAYFTNKELRKLYEKGKSKKYPIPTDIAKKFVMCVQKILAAHDIHDFWRDPSLNFEKLRGYENRYSMRLNQKWRLEMDIEWINDELTVGIFSIDEISNHYK